MIPAGKAFVAEIVRAVRGVNLGRVVTNYLTGSTRATLIRDYKRMGAVTAVAITTTNLHSVIVRANDYSSFKIPGDEPPILMFCAVMKGCWYGVVWPCLFTYKLYRHFTSRTRETTIDGTVYTYRPGSIWWTFICVPNRSGASKRKRNEAQYYIDLGLLKKKSA